MSKLNMQGQLTLISRFSNAHIFTNVPSSRLLRMPGNLLKNVVDVIIKDGELTMREFLSDRWDKKLKIGLEGLAEAGIGDPERAGKFVYCSSGGFILASPTLDHDRLAGVMGYDSTRANVVSAGMFTLTPKELVLYGCSGSMKQMGVEPRSTLDVDRRDEWEKWYKDEKVLTPLDDCSDHNAIAQHFGLPLKQTHTE